MCPLKEDFLSKVLWENTVLDNSGRDISLVPDEGSADFSFEGDKLRSEMPRVLCDGFVTTIRGLYPGPGVSGRSGASFLWRAFKVAAKGVGLSSKFDKPMLATVSSVFYG